MKRKIFVADDSITIQKVVELTFSEGNYEVVCAASGAQAIQRIEEMQPDIALLDIIMPEGNGYDVCAHIKRNERIGWMPVLLLTGTFEPFDEIRAKDAGANGHITKPFESRSLLARVEELLAAHPRPGQTPGQSARKEMAPGPQPGAPSPHAGPDPPSAQTLRINASDLFAQVPAGTAAPRTGPASMAAPAPRPLPAWPDATRSDRVEPPARAQTPPSAPPRGEPGASQPSQKRVSPRAEPRTVAPSAESSRATSTSAPSSGGSMTTDPRPERSSEGGGNGSAGHVVVPPESIERAVREAVAGISEKIVREVAWEVVPDLAESIIRRRIRELEEKVDASRS